MNRFCTGLYDAGLPDALALQVRSAILKCDFDMGGFVTALGNYDAASNTIVDIPSVAALVLQRGFGADLFWLTGTQQNSWFLVHSKNVSRSCIWVDKVILLCGLGCSTHKRNFTRIGIIT